ncbi:MAG: ATP-binding protein [Oscillatoria sp. PMC 1068.18]|nr:ATP-binding protein [Oscillatoria sp. PMC 1076.18]MEC4991541.1 ATP-binding protein [Oscillatoria sp. PMC 1068.18]
MYTQIEQLRANNISSEHLQISRNHLAIESQLKVSRQVLETLEDFVCICNYEGKILYLNSAGRKLIGLSGSEKITHYKCTKFLSKKILNLFAEIDFSNVGESEFWQGESSLLRNDGEEIPVNVSLLLNRSNYGTIEGFSIIAKDRRCQLELEAEKQDIKAKNKRILTAIPDLIFRINQAGVFLDYFPGADQENIFLSTKVKGEKIEEVLSEDLAQWTRYYLEQSLATGEVQQGEFMLQGKEYWQYYEARYIPCDRQEVVVIIRDLTERKRSEAAQRVAEAREREKALQLEQTLQQLQSTQYQLIQAEKLSSLGQMSAGIAHEINNPLTFISVNLSFAQKYLEDLLKLVEVYQQEYSEKSAVVKECIAEIELDYLKKDLPSLMSSMEMGANRIRDIIKSMRNFSRLDEAEKKKVDLHDGLESTLLILQHRLKAKVGFPGIKVIKEYGDLPLVECYAGLMNQVFLNLLSNGIDSLEENCQEQKLAENKQPTIWIRTEKVGQGVRVKIVDNGEGIPLEIQEKIFAPGYTTKPIGKGTGMGLCISHSIVVDKHKGLLVCNSNSGRGAEFVVEIPQITGREKLLKQ